MTASEKHALRLAESLHSRTNLQVVLESLIYGFITVAGFIGNLLVLYIVYKTPRLRNVSGLFVASLALSDVAMASIAATPSFIALISLDLWLRCMSASRFCRHSNGSRLAADHGPYVYRSIFPRCSSNETSKFLHHATRTVNGRVGLDHISNVPSPLSCQW